MFDNVDDIDDSTSRFFVVDELVDPFNAAEYDDGVIDEDDTTTDEPTTLAMVRFFFFATADDLPYFAFVGGLLLLFAMPDC